MKRRTTLAIVFVLLGCAAAPDAVERETDLAPLCGGLVTLAPLPRESCDPGALATYQEELERALAPRAGRALVRVEHDDAAHVRAVCVEAGPGYANESARRMIAEQREALRARPAGPACVAGARVDLNRYAAAEAEVHERETRCQEQSRITREAHGPTAIRGADSHGQYGVYDREFERCMEYQAEWILLEQPGSTRPAIFVKPEIPNPPGASVYDAESHCTRKSQVFEKQAACIEAEGFERLVPRER